jgi:hypothetical protein
MSATFFQPGHIYADAIGQPLADVAHAATGEPT